MILEPNEENILHVANLILKGEVVALPTETVYGLACDALNPEAVSKIYDLKKRPKDNPLICHFHSIDHLDSYVSLDSIPEKYLKILDFLPGPLTLILPVKDKRLKVVSAGLPYVGVRIPASEIFTKVAKIVDRPLAAPSANKSGYCSPTSAEHVELDYEGRLLVLDGPRSLGLESTIVSLIDTPRVIRLGLVPVELIAQKLGMTKEDLMKNSNILAPGKKYLHYAPKKKVLLTNDKSLIKSNDFVVDISSCRDDLVANFYKFFRDADSDPTVQRIILFGNLELEKYPDYVIFDRLQKMGALNNDS